MEEKQVIGVRVSNNGMVAYISVSPTSNEEFTVKQLENALHYNKVVYGIDYKELRRIVEEKCYFTEIAVAKGLPAEDGADGYYEYLFETNTDIKPRILKDGSVDYKSMGEVPVVEAYQELVRYHPATGYVSGKNVYGEEVIGRKGKERPVLKGKGFLVSEDKQLYTAEFTGKAQADIDDGRLTVSRVFVVDHDVSTSTGGVDFIGDIIVNGNVLAGAQVRAGGSIQVNDCVEAAFIMAGGDVVLKNGMQGNGKGMITAGGSVSGKFFEQVYIEAKGDVCANSIMNCDINSEGMVHVSGRFGIIVGGSVRAIQEVEATMIGNMAEIPTRIEVGTSEELPNKLKELDEKLQDEIESLKKLDLLSDKLDEFLKKDPDSENMFNEKKKVTRAKIEKKAAISDIEKGKVEILRLMERVANAKIIVLKSIYPRSTLIINGVSKKLRTENYNVTYKKEDGEIRFTSNI